MMPNHRVQATPGCALLFILAPMAGAPDAERWTSARMSRFATILLLTASVFLAGCSKPDVKYSDLSPSTTATISGDAVTIHLGSDLTASACWTRPKAKVDGHTVYVVGYRTMREQSREFVVQVPGVASSRPVTVVWIDPDGSHVPVPITK